MPADEITSGELGRRLDNLTSELREVNSQLRNLSSAYIPRSEHELVIGGLKIDIRRIEETAVRAAADVTNLDDKLDSRFRTAVITVVSALVFPGVIALVVWLLTLVAS